MDTEGHGVASLTFFEDVHCAQLRAIGFPPTLVPRLFSKLSESSEDLNQYFQLCPDQERSLSACGSVLKCTQSLRALSEVFVLRHVWESDGSERARKELQDDPVLLGRVEGALGIGEGGGGGGGGSGDMVEREMVSVVCEQSGRSEVISRKALAQSGYDLMAAIISAREMTEDEEEEEGEKGGVETEDHSNLTLQEFRLGLAAVEGEDKVGAMSERQIHTLYEDWLRRKSRRGGGKNRRRGEWVHCGAYSWREGSEEEVEDEGSVTVSIPVPPNTKRRDISSEMSTSHWRLEVAGRGKIIDGKFCGRIIPDECFWTLEGGCVSVSVQKSGGWGGLMVGEVQLGKSEEEEEERERGGGGRVRRVGRGRVGCRVEEVMEKMWYVNQTYQAVTEEGESYDSQVIHRWIW